MGIFRGLKAAAELGNVVANQMRERNDAKGVKKNFDDIFDSQGSAEACKFFKSQWLEIMTYQKFTGERPELNFIMKMLRLFGEPSIEKLQGAGLKVCKEKFDEIYKQFKKDFFSIKSVLNSDVEKDKKYVSKRGLSKFQQFEESFKCYMLSIPK